MPDRQPPQNEPEKGQTTAPASNGAMTRRGFLKGAGITAAGTALLDGVQGLQREAAAATTEHVKEYGRRALRRSRFTSMARTTRCASSRAPRWPRRCAFSST